MTNKDLAELIFPNITKTIKDYEEMYPKRDLPEGAAVTRFAPSPTGFMHLGNFQAAIIDYIIAKNTNGVFYLRNEDTDQKREVSSAVELIMKTLKTYDIVPDEYEFEGKIIGNYGPYIQSERKEIYHCFIKHFIEQGFAYPCFCTKEKLDEIRKNQESTKKRTGYYGRYAICRRMSIDEMCEKVKEGLSYVIRFKSNGDFEKKFFFNDEVRGMLSLSENDQDIVIMKSEDKLPTYHFAHLVDDYLMHTTHVVRGEEWLPSAPIHVELFNALGVKPPKYIHTPLLVKKEGNSVRKLSKRKDPEAKMSYYDEKGYPIEAVIESLMTIINSNYEEWHDKNPDKNYLEFEFSAKKMSSSGGALYDIEKLNNISRNFISKLTKEEVYDRVYNWSLKYDLEFNSLLTKYKDYSMNIFNIEREQAKPRKDFETFSNVKDQIWYMYDELFDKYDKNYDYQKITDKEEIKNVLKVYFDKYYDELDDKETWFNKVKDACSECGYCANMKEYKLSPDSYKGSVADFSTILRVSLTTRSMTPDLYEIMKLLGKERIQKRINLI